MKLNLKSLMLPVIIAGSFLFSTPVMAQTSCCKTKNKDKTSCTTGQKDQTKDACKTVANETSGCTPSACRGAKTKFGEAKVISELREHLIDLKAEMEASKSPKFDARSYDIHGIVGDSDEESLKIIIKELKLVEQAFADKLNFKGKAFTLPEHKAKQVAYLNDRIALLKAQL